MGVKEPLFDYISPSLDYQVKQGDALKVVKAFEDGKFDLIITSPPYNIGKSYEVKTSAPKKMQAQMSSGIAYYEGEVYNVMRQGRNNPPVPLLILGIEP